MSVFDSISFGGTAYHEDLFTDLGDGMTLKNNFSAPNTNESSFDEMQPNTISPKEIWGEDFVTSAPPSTAFPNLSTPGSEFLDSPALTGGLDTTPMDDAFLDSSISAVEMEQWGSLFPEENVDQFTKSTTSPTIVQNNSFVSLSDMRSSAPAPATPQMTRQKSSPGRPPMTAPHLRKHSVSSGIVKSQAKPRKSLPEILIDSEDDKETAKRKKNTAAARKSRQRKQEIVETQAAEIDRLRAMVFSLGGNPDT